jgi:hypothetical protein
LRQANRPVGDHTCSGPDRSRPTLSLQKISLARTGSGIGTRAGGFAKTKIAPTSWYLGTEVLSGWLAFPRRVDDQMARSSMLRGTPGWRRMRPARSNRPMDGRAVTPKRRWMSAPARALRLTGMRALCPPCRCRVRYIRVKTRNPQSEDFFSAVPPKADSYHGNSSCTLIHSRRIEQADFGRLLAALRALRFRAG